MTPGTDDPIAPENAPAQAKDSKALFILKRWNEFRIVYNVVLAAFSLLFGGSLIFSDGGTFIATIMYAIVANLCFCAGPMIELHFAIIHNAETSTSATSSSQSDWAYQLSSLWPS